MTDINRHQDWLDMLERMKASNRIHNKNYHQGYFIPKNWQKCDNVLSMKPIIYRSSWELDVMNYFDQNDAFIRWSSELLSIRYKNLISNKMSLYYPDFFVQYVDKNGQLHTEVLEVKPRNQTVLKETRNGKDRLEFVKNLTKWEAAIKFCQKRGWQFRVLTQQDLYRA